MNNEEQKLKKLLNKKGKLAIEISLSVYALRLDFIKRHKGTQVDITDFYAYLYKTFDIKKREARDYLRLAKQRDLHKLRIYPSKLFYLAYQSKSVRLRFLKHKDRDNLTLKQIKNLKGTITPDGYFPNWQTPKEFVDQISNHFNWSFTTDPCSSENNLKMEKYFSKKEDGLKQSWGKGLAFVNPPFSQKEKWVEAGIKNLENGTPSVFLLPVSTDTNLFHNVIFKRATRIIFVHGRISFIRNTKEGKNPPFAVMLIEFSNKKATKPQIQTFGENSIDTPDLKVA